MRFLTILFCTFSLFGIAQNSSLTTADQVQDFGTLKDIYSIKTAFVLRNTNAKKLYVMRADAAYGIKVRINSKMIAPGDTSTLHILMEPKKEGKFEEKISIVTSTDAQPFVLTIKGDIERIERDDKTACYSFSNTPKQEKDDEEKKVFVMPTFPKINLDSIRKPNIRLPSLKRPKTTEEQPTKEEIVGLDERYYKSNNITFIIDVSSSMRKEERLNLLKSALLTFSEELRAIDIVNIVAYSDSARTLVKGMKGNNTELFTAIIDSLHAKGPTMGATAILYATDIALEAYQENGNNQLFLITDGKFSFNDYHFKKWTTKMSNRKLVLSAIAVGNDKCAMTDLPVLAEKTKGSYIAIQNDADTKSLILEEIKMRSKK